MNPFLVRKGAWLDLEPGQFWILADFWTVAQVEERADVLARGATPPTRVAAALIVDGGAITGVAVALALSKRGGLSPRRIAELVAPHWADLVEEEMVAGKELILLSGDPEQGPSRAVLGMLSILGVQAGLPGT